MYISELVVTWKSLSELKLVLDGSDSIEIQLHNVKFLFLEWFRFNFCFEGLKFSLMIDDLFLIKFILLLISVRCFNLFSTFRFYLSWLLVYRNLLVHRYGHHGYLLSFIRLPICLLLYRVSWNGFSFAQLLLLQQIKTRSSLIPVHFRIIW